MIESMQEQIDRVEKGVAEDLSEAAEALNVAAKARKEAAKALSEAVQARKEAAKALSEAAQARKQAAQSAGAVALVLSILDEGTLWRTET